MTNADVMRTTVRYGSSLRNTGGLVVGVSSYVEHPNYNDNTLDNDVSMLVLSADIVFSNAARSIDITDVEPADGTPTTVTGWGTTSEGGSLADHLLAVSVPIVNRAACNQAYGGSITANMICAGVPEGGLDACQGDSGGPLIDPATGRLVGVVSWGFGCARPNFPGIYANVDYVRDWIVSQL